MHGTMNIKQIGINCSYTLLFNDVVSSVMVLYVLTSWTMNFSLAETVVNAIVNLL